MQITSKVSLTFNVYQYLYGVVKNWYSQASAVLLASASVFPGYAQTIPDWCSFDPNYLLALAAGNVTVVTAPTGCATLNAGTASSNILLPTIAGAQAVVVTNSGSGSSYSSDACVLLGDSSVEVTQATGTSIPAGSSIILPLRGNTYIAGIALGQLNETLNIAVI